MHTEQYERVKSGSYCWIVSLFFFLPLSLCNDCGEYISEV